MKLTARQTATATLADLCRAADRRQAVTITYTKATGEESVRTIEIHDIRTTKAGDLILRAADRQSGEMRTFRVDRIQAYTLHRTGYAVELPATETPAAPAAPAVTVEEIVTRELARDDREQPGRYHHAA